MKGIEITAAIVLASTGFAGIARAAGRSCSTCMPSKVGDVVHRNSSLTAAFVGHAGILSGPNIIANVSTGRGNAALAHEDFASYLDGQEFWGAKRPSAVPAGLSPEKRRELQSRLNFYNASAIRYDDNHLDQKGTFFDDGGYWEFDCVGFVERVLEDIGYDLTPRGFESGRGWPLTVREQRDDSNAVDAI